MNQLSHLLSVMELTDIWKAASRVIDAAVEKAYNGEKRIEWKEVLAGQKAFDTTGEWLLKKHLIQLKNI